MAPTLLGQLSRAHTFVVAGTCALLVLATMTSSGVVLRDRQDRTLEAITIEVVNGIVVEAAEEKLSMAEAAEQFFAESPIEGFRFELLDERGALVASDGEIGGWRTGDYVVEVNAQAGEPQLRPGAGRQGRFRACARWCGSGHTVRVITPDVLHRPEIRRVGAALLGALPLAAAIGALLGGALFRRYLRPLGRLEAAASAASADPEATLRVEANAREIETLRDSFNGLLARLGEALSRERRFSNEASHELRTPLAAVRGRLEQLLADRGLSASQAEHAAIAMREVDGLDRLVDALLLLARSESAALPSTPVNLCDLAREIAAKQAARDGATVPPPQVEAPDEILVRGSEDLLTRAIANLIENARKFGGPTARVRVRVTADGSDATIAVADDGPGLSESDRLQVFERFFRASATRHQVEGVGLGLAVARTIALRHGGRIEVRPSDWSGSEFRISIPLLRPAQRGEPALTGTPEPTGSA